MSEKMEIKVDATVNEKPALYLRQNMLSLHDGEEEVAEVSVGAGLGSDAIILMWKGKQAVIRGRDLLRAYVAQVSPGDVSRIPQ